MTGLAASERRWSGPLCGCGATQLSCEADRYCDQKKCCWGCEHAALPPDIRPQAEVEPVKDTA